MSDIKDDLPDSHGWIEYRRLILNELEQLNAMTAAQSNVLREIDKTLMRQADQLEEHMRRTEAAEASIKQINVEMEPIKHKSWLSDIIFKAVAGTAATIVAFVELYKYFNKS